MAQIQFRRDTAAAWTAANPTLASGEIGFETDTAKHKLGNGSAAWNSLAYVQTVGPPGTASAANTIELGGQTDTTLSRLSAGVLAVEGVPVVTTTSAQSLSNKTLTSPTLTGTITGAADATTVTSGKVVTGSVLSTQPDGGAGFFAMIPRLYNDLAYCGMRPGGAVTITKNGVAAVLSTDYLLPDQLFAPGGSSTYLLSTVPGDVWVFEVTVPTGVDLSYGAMVGISGPNGYRAKDATIETYYNGAWNTAITSTNQASGDVWKYFSSGASSASKIRYTLTDFSTTQCRILSLYAVGSASPLASGSLLPRTGGAVYGTTAAPPTFTATGSDAAISLNLVPKGSGTVNAGGNPVGVKVGVPATATSTGVVGQWAADSNWHYVCTATDTWRRVALATW